MEIEMSEQVIRGLEPKILWQRFYEITRVPRPSKKEWKILEHIINLCKQLNVSFKQDKVGNILISIPAAKGYEKSQTVVLQGHVDMVCEKNKATQHDFNNDPIKMKREDGWITADGTTLGSDNGIGVAAALAVITDKEIVHGPVEILLTIDEETGLTGADNLEQGFISGKILLNLDSEEDGTFYIGCAGGIDTSGIFQVEFKESPSGKQAVELMITGLKGGHSGSEINTGRANAIKLLARSLRELDGINFDLASISGGSKRNAIPREAEAVLLINISNFNKVESIIKEFEQKLNVEYKASDGGVKIEFKKSSAFPKKVFTDSFKEKILSTLLAVPHGVIEMSQDIEGLVETSTNLATVVFENNTLTVGTSQRSSIESAKKYIAQSVASVFSLAGGRYEHTDGYPGWKPNMDSEILELSERVYTKLFKEKPEVKAIHAGLECGILGDRNPGLDMISFGPTITGAHSPDERVEIKTVEKFYELLKGILREIAGA